MNHGIRATSLEIVLGICVFFLTLTLCSGALLVLAAHFCIWPVAPWCSW